MRKFRTVSAAITAAAIMLSVPVYADYTQKVGGVRYRYSDSGELIGKFTGWIKSSKGLKCYKNGKLVRDEWVFTKDGREFYVDSSGVRLTGWVPVKNNWYYITPQHGRLTGQYEIKGIAYSFGEDGKWDKNYRYGNMDTAEIYSEIKSRLSEKAYGGMYISNGMVVIWSVDGRAEAAVQKILPNVGGVVYKKADYSLHVMKKIKTEIETNHIGDFESVEIDVFSNRINLTATDEQYKRLKKLIKSLKNPKSIVRV